MTNLIAVLIGSIIGIVGIGSLLYPPLTRLINFPGNERLKALTAIIIGCLIIILGFML